MATRSSIALALIVSVAVAPVGGCATSAVVNRWNPSGHVTVGLQAGPLAMPTPSFRWQMSRPVGDSAPVTSGAVELTPSLEGCEAVELYSLNGIGPAGRVTTEAEISYVQTADVTPDVVQQIWETLEDPQCAVLLTAGIDRDNQAVIRVSTRAGPLETVPLGPTKRNGWIAALPLSATFDAATVLLVLALLVASLDDHDHDDDDEG